MRSSRPIPGNPWPHDMVITIDDDLQQLLELLWIREAWQLRPVGEELPPELVDTPSLVDESTRSSAPIAQWQAAWPGIWEASLRHAGTTRQPEIFEKLRRSENGSAERAGLLRELGGPSWRDGFGSEALAAGARQWIEALARRRMDRFQRPPNERPERASLDALISAWRSGLTKIVEIPCRGSFTRVIGAHALLVTAETRANAERYSEALARFR